MSLAHAIMTAVLDDELTGYELAKRFDTSLGFFWQASHQQIYRELKTLSEKNFLTSRAISQQKRPDKTVYRLTDEGLEHLQAWVHNTTKPRLAKDELFIKLYNLSEDNLAALIGEVRERREHVQRNLSLYYRIREKSYANFSELSTRMKGVALVLDAGIRDAESILLWCDSALERLGMIKAG